MVPVWFAHAGNVTLGALALFTILFVLLLSKRKVKVVRDAPESTKTALLKRVVVNPMTFRVDVLATSSPVF